MSDFQRNNPGIIWPMNARYDFAVLGNTVVDGICHVDERVLKTYNLKKGDSNTVSAATMFELAGLLTVEQFRSGGSAANTAYTLGKLGSKVCFLGRLGADPTGRHFAEEMIAAGVSVTPPHAGHRTTEVFTLITPDGMRTMVQGDPPPPSPDDSWVDEKMLEDSGCLIIGAYAMGTTPAAAIFAAQTMAKLRRPICISLASPRAVQAAQSTLIDVIQAHHPLVIGNTAEWDTLVKFSDPHTVEILEKTPRVMTRSGLGASFHGFDASGTPMVIDSTTQPIPKPTDVSGAGDAFAAGFLRTYMGGGSAQLALHHGHQLGRAVVLQLGPRLAGEIHLES